jgi:PPM family protein phosphatase
MANNGFLTVTSAALSVAGKRRNNEDALLVDCNDSLQPRQIVLAVADGMGGHERGEEAAQLMIAELQKANRHAVPPDGARIAIRSWVEAANGLMRAASAGVRAHMMGCTVSGALVVGNRALVFNVGDSRTFLADGAGIRQISEDHSVMQDAIRKGLVAPGVELGEAFAHALVRSVGTDAHVEPDIFPADGWLELAPGQVLLSCSDGLWNAVTASALHRELIGRADLDSAVASLVALADANGSPDNISLAALEFGQLARRDLHLPSHAAPPPARRWWHFWP